MIIAVTPRSGTNPIPLTKNDLRNAGFKTSFSNDFLPNFYNVWKILKIKSYKVRGAQ